MGYKKCLEAYGYKRGTNRDFGPFETKTQSKKEPPGRQLFFRTNPVFMRVCDPYFSASDTATAQATVAPTMGLLPYQNYWIFRAFILVPYIVESHENRRFEAIKQIFLSSLKDSLISRDFRERGTKRVQVFRVKP